MSNEEIWQKAKEFASIESRQMYTVVVMANEWQKETGGTLDELLEYLDTHLPKKTSCRA